MREIWLWLEFVHKPPPLAPPTGGPPIAFYSGFYCFMGISPENDWKDGSVSLRFTLTTQLLRNFRQACMKKSVQEASLPPLLHSVILIPFFLLLFYSLAVCMAPQIELLLFSCSVVSNSLQSHGLQPARIPCPSLSPGVSGMERQTSEMRQTFGLIYQRVKIIRFSLHFWQEMQPMGKSQGRKHCDVRSQLSSTD